LSIKRRPAENRCAVAQERRLDEVWKNFHARSRTCQSARRNAVDHHSALGPGRPTIEVGENTTTAAQVAGAGATAIVAGSAIFGAKDYAKAIAGLRAEAAAVVM
jgi:hypothetical protein